MAQVAAATISPLFVVPPSPRFAIAISTESSKDEGNRTISDDLERLLGPRIRVRIHASMPRQGEKGPARAAYVLSKQTLVQQALAKALKLDELQIAQRR